MACLVRLAPIALAGFLAACSNKMDPKDCAKLRESAFDLINQASVCSTDADCMPSAWPGCAKPLSKASGDKIKGMMESFQKGQCAETKMDCQPPPTVYCQEGLCAFRYKPADPSGGGMRIE
jgi:hypothetical protein